MKADRNKNRGIIIGLVILAIIAVFVLIVAVVMTLRTDSGTPGNVATVTTTMATTAPIEQGTGNAVLGGEITTVAQGDVTPQGGDSTTAVQQQSVSPSQLTTDQIVSNMMAAVAQVKSNATFQGRKQQVISLTLVDSSLPSAVTSIANSIVQRLAGSEDTQYSFAGGVATDTATGDTDTTANAIPPSNGTFTIDPNGLASATAQQSGSNTVYTVVFKPEQTSMASPKPYYHAMAMDYLNLADVDISPAEITQADIYYSGATVTVTVDGNGRIIGFYEKMPVNGTGGGKLVVSASGTIEGYLEETWTFTW